MLTFAIQQIPLVSLFSSAFQSRVSHHFQDSLTCMSGVRNCHLGGLTLLHLTSNCSAFQPGQYRRWPHISNSTGGGEPQCTSIVQSQLMLHPKHSIQQNRLKGVGRILHLLMRGDAKEDAKRWDGFVAILQSITNDILCVKESSNSIFSLSY